MSVFSGSKHMLFQYGSELWCRSVGNGYTELQFMVKKIMNSFAQLLSSVKYDLSNSVGTNGD